jgi:hypothetical protein
MTPREHEYVEGVKATENFEEGMKALFKVIKDSVARAGKKSVKAASLERKPKSADKD